MRQVIYAMQFRGQAAPSNEAGTVMTARTKAESCAVRSVVGRDGLSGRIEPADGEAATFESEVRFGDESAFLEDGTIDFGHGNRLRFSTVGQGHLGGCADPGLKHGSVIWRIDGGDGQFEGATGLITSNFFVGSAGEVTDNHFGVIFVR